MSQLSRGAHLQDARQEQRQHGRVRDELQDDNADGQHACDGGDRQAGQAVLARRPPGAAAARVARVNHLAGNDDVSTSDGSNWVGLGSGLRSDFLTPPDADMMCQLSRRFWEERGKEHQTI